MNTIVYATEPHLFEKLKAKTINVTSSISVNYLASVVCELQNHTNLCISNDGGHVETLKE